ncbi:FkbM family methyltransferase [Ekhidna sp. To15]|uniref:FkbM family methyltransferase n=1 Tax=Ekhidna sp. To15 TaxID=3395267 RepID=UPI003F5276E0
MLGETVRRIVRNLTGLSVYKKQPIGVDCLEDIIFYLGKSHFNILFDIGANIGQTAKSLRKYFPEAAIYCFEPIGSTFLQLKKNISDPNCFLYNVGIGEKNGVAKFSDASDGNDSAMWTLAKTNDGNANVEVQILTLDSFCNENEISSIDYMKTDTEGFEIEVLKGASGMLSEGKIKVLNIEVGMNYKNTYHNSFTDIQSIMESHGYVLFGIYDQIHEWKLKKPYLRVCNCVFINSNFF